VIHCVCWNVAQAHVWTHLGELQADVALLQEVAAPSLSSTVEVLPRLATHWVTAGRERRRWRAAIARLSDRVALDPRPTFTAGFSWT
jgi:hypothetical protein